MPETERDKDEISDIKEIRNIVVQMTTELEGPQIHLVQKLLDTC